tara:strand:+ start:1832 stop:2584 length:753 start_codon:yes stop_codon:yes gene_type:complete
MKKINRINSGIILLGGAGSRFSKINEQPKQLAKIKNKIILLRIIHNLNKYGLNYFIFPLGYKKKFFINFFKSKTVIKKNNFKIVRNTKDIDSSKINIKFFNAGLQTSKLNRIQKSIKFLNQKDFLVTYGDGLADININSLQKKYFKLKNKISFISSYYKNSQYGHLNLSPNNYVKSFEEKPKLQGPVNIGFYIFNEYTFNKYYNPNHELENNYLRTLIKKKILKSHLHKGYFFSIDSKKDILTAEKYLKK